jgi:hypothetical protein
MGEILGAVRSFVVHTIAVLVIVLTYALGSAGTHILSVAGLSGLALATSATPADAYRRRRRRRCYQSCRHSWYSRRRCRRYCT